MLFETPLINNILQWILYNKYIEICFDILTTSSIDFSVVFTTKIFQWRYCLANTIYWRNDLFPSLIFKILFWRVLTQIVLWEFLIKDKFLCSTFGRFTTIQVYNAATWFKPERSVFQLIMETPGCFSEEMATSFNRELLQKPNVYQ